MKFDKVTLEHINLAVNDFKEKGFPEGFKHSIYFDVKIDEVLYPPKPIMAYANFYATGQKPTNNFSGGIKTPCFNAYEKLGLEIFLKTNPKELDKFISAYKDLIQDKIDDVAYNELYKWETIQHFQNNWKDDFNERNILQNLNDSFNYENNNLWSGSHYLPLKMLKDFAIDRPQKVSQMMYHLYNEELPLNDRLLEFENGAEELLNELRPNENISHYQSGRAMILYLSLRYPDKYFLYKNGMFNDFCEITQFWPAFGKAKKKDNSVLDDYFKMCNALKEILEKDDELLSIHRSRLPEEISFNDDNNVLVQDFIYAVVTYLNPDNYKMNVNTDATDEVRLINILRDIGFKDSTDFYSLMETVLNSLNVSTGDKRVCYSLPKNKLIGLTIGQKYCTVIEIKKKHNTYLYFDTTRDEKNWFKESSSLEEMKNQLETIIQSAKKELAVTEKTGYSNHSSTSLEKSLFDNEYKAYIFKEAFNKEFKTNNMSTDLNQIFFGPPGTGKTYHTINEAIKIADPIFYNENKDDRDKLKERFKLLLLNNDNEAIGQIGFTTFHQSFSYEDFIEGIKPIEPVDGDTYLKYEIQEGVFKRICRLANDSIKAKELDSKNLINLNEEEFEKTQFYKISLGNTQLEEDKEIFGYCIKNNCITIGFGEGKNLEGLGEKDIRIWGKENNQSDDSIRSLNYFKNFLKIGHYILVSNGNHYCRAIGKVVGEYEYQESPFSDNSTYNHFRKIEWLVSGEDIPVKDLYYKNFTQKTIYNLEKSEIKKEFFIKGVQRDNLKLPKNPKNFVLVIDEINRGNVSSIFGELITLIEKDKRAGMTEELSAILPYSKKVFKVPHNVFIIGTMNTADRSIEALDTALRRRFSFREMPPIPELIATEGKLKNTQGKIGDIDVERILETINDRIEKLIDKDHKIGHSYFLGVSDEHDLKTAFKNKVIPLLEEYFFGDFGKISLVLGSSFITKTTKANVTFAKTNEYDSSVAADLLERSVYEVTEPNNWDFKAIYE